MLVEDAEMRTVGQIGFGKEFVYEQMRLPKAPTWHIASCGPAFP